jgi:hypothetical protein
MKQMSEPFIARSAAYWNIAAHDEEATMRTREREVNAALQALDDDHRQRRIQRDEYRQRRRVLLESLAAHVDDGDAGRDTVRRMVKAAGAESLSHAQDGCVGSAADVRLASAGRGARPLTTYAVLLGVVAAGVMLFCLFTFA